MRRGRVTGVVGRGLLGVGVLILLFVAYQLWGTGFAESHSQALLRQRFDAVLRHDRGSTPTTSTTTAPSGSTSTPSGGASTTTATTEPPPTVGPTITAPNEGSPVGIIRIDKIGLDKVIVEGTATNDLRQGPGHYIGTPLPGEAGNAAIAGHRTTYGAPFYDLDKLSAGDLIDVTTVQGAFTYQVTGSLVVSPSDDAVVADTPTPQLTLTTCNPRFSASSRLVVRAKLITPPAPTLPPAPTVVHGHHETTAVEASGLGGSQGDWVPALELGALTAAIFGIMLAVAHRRRRPVRWAVYAVGGAASLVALFFFFGAVSPLLPASF